MTLAIPLFAGGFALMMLFAWGAERRRHLVALMDEIEKHDRIRIDDLSLKNHLTNAELARLITRLIETKNLVGYTVVAEFGVAKSHLNAQPKDFLCPTVVASITAPRKSSCDNCGSPVVHDRKYCGHCGTKY